MRKLTGLNTQTRHTTQRPTVYDRSDARALLTMTSGNYDVSGYLGHETTGV